MIKVSFLGDLLCEAPFFRAAGEGGQYDFGPAFDGIREKCAGSDLLIGNLETPLAGEEAGYVDDRFSVFSMNAPAAFAEAVQQCGVDMVLTANNHAFDRGPQGAVKTLDALDSIGLKHTGTYRGENEERTGYLRAGDTVIAMISCTASTNEKATGYAPSDGQVDLLRTQDSKWRVRNLAGLKNAVKGWTVVHVIGTRRNFAIKRKLGLRYNRPSTDNSLDRKDADRYLDVLRGRIAEAKEKADLVFVCPHMGGQFNASPGAFSEYVMERLAEAGADAVVGMHPHVIQKMETLNGRVPCFYSIGNACMSMSTVYMIRDNQPDYGLMAHFYIRDKKIRKVTGSLIRMRDDDKGYVHVRMVKDLYDRGTEQERAEILRDVRPVLDRLRPEKREQTGAIEEEYVLYGESETDE